MQNMSGGKTSLGLETNLAALLCYILTPCCLIGTILSLILFFTEKNNRFVRFHAMQSILIFAVNLALGIAVGILATMMYAAGMEGMAGGVVLLRYLLGLVFLVIFIYAGIQAYQGNQTKLPVIGDLAEKWSS
jgi:uncharacterized membrane protein